MIRITVLGLETGDWRELTLGNMEIINTSGSLWIKNEEYPVVKYFESKGIEYNCLDRASSSEAANKLYELAQEAGGLIYLLAARNPFDDSTVKLLSKQKNIVLKVIFPMHQGVSSHYPLDPLMQVMHTLRSPGGCPWDREQTHQSLKRYLIEETYEVIEAIEEENMNKICEELGDLLLQIVFHSQLAEERNIFDINAVIKRVKEKMIRRHPHVFGDKEIKTSQEVEHTWANIKANEKALQAGEQLLMDIPRGLPALMRAEKLQKRAAGVGFEWEEIDGAIEKLFEEIEEIEEACREKGKEAQVEEMGDILFAVVNIARYLEIDPEEALNQTNNKFIRRFNYIERHAEKALQDMSLEEMDKLWDKAKQNLVNKSQNN